MREARRSKVGGAGRLPRSTIRLLATTATSLVCTVVVTGCGGSDRGSTRLIDGSSARPIPAAIATIAPDAVLARVRIYRASEAAGPARSCLRSLGRGRAIAPRARVVERIRTGSSSITLEDARGRWVLGCDRTPVPAENGDPWCSTTVGRRFGGRLRDARVSIVCRDRSGRPVGFGWVEPTAKTRWVLSRTPSGVDAEPVVRGLPVRVVAAGLDFSTSSATFRIEEVDASGRTIARYRLTAGVAG